MLGHEELAAEPRCPRTLILRGGLVGNVKNPPRLHPELQLCRENLMAHRIPATCFAFAEILGTSRKNPRKRTPISDETYGEQFSGRWRETVTDVVTTTAKRNFLSSSSIFSFCSSAAANL